MASVDVEVESVGWEQVIENLEYIEIALPNEITIEEIRWILTRAKEIAKILAPVRTGELRDSIDIKVDESQKVGSLFATAKHGPYVELGTSRMRARPFMAPAIFQALADFQKTFPGRFNKVIQR